MRSKRAVADKTGDGLDIRSGDAVFFEMRHDAADGGVGLGNGVAGTEREAIVEALRCTHEFDGENDFEVLDDLAEFQGSGHAHGDVIFFAS